MHLSSNNETRIVSNVIRHGLLGNLRPSNTKVSTHPYPLTGLAAHLAILALVEEQQLCGGYLDLKPTTGSTCTHAVHFSTVGVLHESERSTVHVGQQHKSHGTLSIDDRVTGDLHIHWSAIVFDVGADMALSMRAEQSETSAACITSNLT